MIPEGEAREARLRRAARKYLLDTAEDQAFGVAERHFGVELEFSIVDPSFMPMLGTAEAVWRQRGGFAVEQELGSFQIETNPPPEVLAPGAFHRLHQTLAATVAAMEESCAGLGGGLLPIGLAPCLPPALFNAPGFFTQTDRYRASAAFSRRHRQEARIQFERRPSMILPIGSAVALINELHVHVEALSAEEIGLLFEAAQDITPLLTALGANSGWFDGERLQYVDHQVRLFAECEARPKDPRGAERVGFYPRPFEGLADYFDWTAAFPLWVEVDESQPRSIHQAIEKGYYGWVRLRLEDTPQPSLRVELRVPSVQPTLRENVALAEWAVKAVVERARSGVSGLSVEHRRINLERCACLGLDAEIYWNAGDGVKERPVVAVVDGLLADLGEGEYLSLLVPRLRRRMVPALLLANECERMGVTAGLEAYRSHFQWDEPYVA